jgi:dephospho-CoA kinase
MYEYIAIVGPIAAGKTTVADILRDNYGFATYKLSQGIYDEADRLGLDREDRVVLQDLGDKLRKEQGVDVLAKLAINKILRQAQDDKDAKFVIESIRNHNEVLRLQQELGDKLYVIAVDAPMEVRYERAVKREGQYKEQHLSFEEFKKIAERDLGKESDEAGQNVIKCMQLADVKVDNSGTKEELEVKLKEIIES